MGLPPRPSAAPLAVEPRSSPSGGWAAGARRLAARPLCSAPPRASSRGGRASAEAAPRARGRRAAGRRTTGSRWCAGCDPPTAAPTSEHLALNGHKLVMLTRSVWPTGGASCSDAKPALISAHSSGRASFSGMRPSSASCFSSSLCGTRKHKSAGWRSIGEANPSPSAARRYTRGTPSSIF